MKTQQLFTAVVAVLFLVTLTSAKHAENSNTSAFTSDYEFVETLAIEDWMTNDNLWNASEEVLDDANTDLAESDLLIEEWMSDDSYWKF